MAFSAALTATIFPTNSCIRKMHLTRKTQFVTATIAADNNVKHGKTLCTASVKHGCSIVPDIALTLEPQYQSILQREPGLQQEVVHIKKIMARKSREGNQVEVLIMIDTIQRLGLDCYFHKDIHDVLERQHYVQCMTTSDSSGEDLHDVALRFRLLRQAGYNVPSDIFHKFKDCDGKFREELHTDTSGLLNLFEASHLAIPEDQILDDAGEFCRSMLESTLKNVVVQSEANLIGKTLETPHHKRLPRLTTQSELNTLESTPSVFHDCCGINDWMKEVQNLAKIDVNKAQIAHQNEITQVSRWWEELGLTKNLKLARSQPVKWHMWSMVVLPGHDMAELRIELTKAISFIYLIDDIFDVYGTLEELALFTKAVNRWDSIDTEGLPDYMVLCLNALYATTNEISNKVYAKYGWNPDNVLQKAWAELCNAFLVEARWFNSGQLPTTEEYMKNGIISSGVYIVSANVFCLLGEAVNNKSTGLLTSHSGIVSSAARILRLWDDLGTAKDENQDGNDGSYIACYMNQYKDVSAESARGCVIQMISNAWKCLNQECLSHSPFSTEFRAALLNLARMVPIMYSYDKNNHLPSLEKHMKMLLHE